MSTDRNIESLIDRITLENLTYHMQKLGWYRVPGFGSRRQIFKLKQMEGMDLILPSSLNYLGAEKSIRDALLTLSQIHSTSLNQLAAEIINDHADSMLIRLQVPGSTSSIPMEDAPRHIKAIRNLILYSACAEIDARPYYDEPPEGAMGLVKQFDFCHTFKGSFGFEISSAIAPPNSTTDLFDAPPQRKIVERVARGLLLLDSAVKLNDPKTLLNSYETAFNSKMCDAIADISLDGKMNYDLQIEWASCITPNEDVIQFSSRRISEPEVEMLRFVSEQLKIVKPKPDEISGHVINLHCVDNPSKDNSRRTVSIKVDHESHGKIEVRMQLGPDFYLRTVEAHSSGLRIFAKGQLQRKGSSWSLDGVTKLELVGSATNI